MPRLSKDEYFMALAEITASRSTCRHRRQGAVLIKDDRVISTGYNGSPPGLPHCDVTFCNKDQGGYCRAEGLHAEINAIVSAARLGISTKGAVLYCIYSPCRACCNVIKTAGISSVRYKEVYPQFPDGPIYLTITLLVPAIAL